MSGRQPLSLIELPRSAATVITDPVARGDVLDGMRESLQDLG
jgi:hypothetical protein